ncbi:hypothetical protein V1506DRAFT_545056 [Lipomyces tetrasporus]
MLSDGLSARQRINKYLKLQAQLPAFTTQGWLRFAQINTSALNFNELTLFISKKKPQISLAVPIYYELHYLLNDASEFKNGFVDLDPYSGLAVKEGIKKYNK